MLKYQLNRVDPGDDPENRYDCDSCGYAPEEHEHIVLIEVVGEIVAKYCDDCAERLLTKGAQLEADWEGS